MPNTASKDRLRRIGLLAALGVPVVAASGDSSSDTPTSALAPHSRRPALESAWMRWRWPTSPPMRFHRADGQSATL